MTLEEIARRLYAAQGFRPRAEPHFALLGALAEARQQWLDQERKAILALVEAWIGDTVEGRDLCDTIRMRGGNG